MKISLLLALAFLHTAFAQEAKTAAAKPKSVEEQISEIRKKADAGDGEAVVTLVNLVFAGQIKDIKPEAAAKMLEKAAEGTHAPAQLAYAKLLSLGVAGVKNDPERAMFLVQQAAEAGLAAGQYAYGDALMAKVDPKARDVNYAEPISWLKKAAEQNNGDALCRLGVMQLNGMGMEANKEEGWKQMLKAARTGHALALNECAICLQKGLGVTQDEIAAIGYFHASADLGNTAAMVNLASCYRTGNGVPKDMNKAGALFAGAAKLNFGPAQFIIAELFQNGEGTPVNPMNAAVNFYRAGKNGISEGQKRCDQVVEKFTAEEKKQWQNFLKTGDVPEPKKPAAK